MPDICLVTRNRTGRVVPCARAHDCTNCAVPLRHGFRWNFVRARWERAYNPPSDAEAAIIICREALDEEVQK